MGEQSHFLVFVVVIPYQHAPRRIGQPQQRVQGRTQPAGVHFGHHLIAGMGRELEHIHVAGSPDTAVDGTRRGDSLRLLCSIVRLGFVAFRQRIHGVGKRIG